MEVLANEHREEKPLAVMNSFKKYVLVGSGFLSLVVGIIGIFMPLLPSTPFLLLSAYCFLKSSKRLYKWLLDQKVIGPQISNYLKYRAVTKKTKVLAMLWLWVSLGVSIYFFSIFYISVLLISIGVGVSIHILLLGTYNPKEPHEI